MVYSPPNAAPDALLVPEGYKRARYPTNLKHETRGKVFIAWTTRAGKKSGGVRRAPVPEGARDVVRVLTRGAVRDGDVAGGVAGRVRHGDGARARAAVLAPDPAELRGADGPVWLGPAEEAEEVPNLHGDRRRERKLVPGGVARARAGVVRRERERPAGADEHVDQMRRRQQVQVALQRLNQRQREVLVLTDLEGRSAPEVSEMIGVPVGTVYSRLHHARRAFSKALTAVGQDSSERLGRSPLGKVIGA